MVQHFAPKRVLALSCSAIAGISRSMIWSPQTLKIRLDKLLVDRGLAASRERAQALIIAGKVLVNDQKIEKAGAQVVC